MSKIRKATLDDLEETVNLFEKYRAFYRCSAAGNEARTFIQQRLVNSDSVILLAFADTGTRSHATGFIQLYPLFSSTAMKRLWLLNDLYVDEPFRRRNVGLTLMNAAVELAKSTSSRGIILETEATNTVAHGLYEKMGFHLNTNYFYSRDLDQGIPAEPESDQ